MVPSKYNVYEFLYLFKNGVKVVNLSDYYHKNYDALKTRIAALSKNLGVEEYKVGREVKEIFKGG
jgi:hypothetical protein